MGFLIIFSTIYIASQMVGHLANRQSKLLILDRGQTSDPITVRLWQDKPIPAPNMNKPTMSHFVQAP